MRKILIVEDEKAISNLIYINLVQEGYQCTCAFNGKEGADFVEQNHVDLVLLDIMLPEINGYELLEFIKPLGIPVIFISAKGMVQDKILGLNLGADDYLEKPFQIGELIARVEAVLRRVGNKENYLEFAGVKISLDSRQVTKNKKEIELTSKEFDLLVALVRNKNIALYRDRLYEMVWEEEYPERTRTLDSHIQRLRRKLEWEDHIKTVFRIGYRLEE